MMSVGRVTVSELAGRLLAATPDIPRWLEVRALLLNAESEILGGRETSGVVVHTGARLIGIAGMPPAEVLRDAVARCAGDAVVVADPGQIGFVTGALPRCSVRRAGRFVFRRESLPAGPRRRHRVRPVSRSEVLEAEDVPEELRACLLRASGMANVVAAFASGKPVSFAAVNWETETLCDLYAETLPGLRGRGYAEASLDRMVREARFRGKLAAGVVEWSNPQSLSLVKKLGAARIGECALIDTAGV
jgi:GNAT superfamily N-acetyltransferase